MVFPNNVNLKFLESKEVRSTDKDMHYMLPSTL